MKSVRKRQKPYGIIYMWNLKYDTNEPIYETETDSQTYHKVWLAIKAYEGGKDWEFGISGGKLSYTE